MAISRRTIRRDLDRGAKFLGAVSKKSKYRAAMERFGYTAETHRQGWRMYLYLVGYLADTSSDTPAVPADLTPQQKAIAFLDAWDGPNFKLARAALEHLHPEQAVFVFNGLTAQEGAASVGAVTTFLDRVELLRSGSDPNRASTRDADRQAVETLLMRKILMPELEAELRGYIETASSLAPPPAHEAEEVVDPEYEKVAEQFHAWLIDWRTTARHAITRRDYQIELGLTKRRSSKAGEAGDADDDEDDGDLGS